jgi:hypothetical protein
MRGSIAYHAPKLATWGALAAVAVCFGYVSSAYVSGNAPFRTDRYFGRGQVLRALPRDFPVPPLASIDGAGPGSHLPYRVEWKTPGRTSEVAGLMRTQLNDGTWRVVDSSEEDGKLRFRSTRAAADGMPPVIAEITISAAGAGSTVLLEFSPLPSNNVPGYDEWLKSIGLVVHNVDPNSPAARVLDAP